MIFRDTAIGEVKQLNSHRPKKIKLNLPDAVQESIIWGDLRVLREKVEYWKDYILELENSRKDRPHEVTETVLAYCTVLCPC